jgi:uncharacterized coiled-coil protein SlyX
MKYPSYLNLYQTGELERRVEKLEEKIDAMHEEFITKEDHYRDISGWRGEIHKLDSKIDRLMEKLLEGLRR